MAPQTDKFRAEYTLDVADLKEPAPMPDGVPKVAELGVTSAPLKSAAFFLGSFCKEFTEDFMLCKAETDGDPSKCLLEGRRVTRCATDFVNQMRANCGQLYEEHWQCLERHNQKLYPCRNAERRLSECVFDKMGLKKELPGAEGVPVHERTQVYWKPKEG